MENLASKQDGESIKPYEIRGEADCKRKTLSKLSALLLATACATNSPKDMNPPTSEDVVVQVENNPNTTGEKMTNAEPADESKPESVKKTAVLSEEQIKMLTENGILSVTVAQLETGEATLLKLKKPTMSIDGESVSDMEIYITHHDTDSVSVEVKPDDSGLKPRCPCTPMMNTFITINNSDGSKNVLKIGSGGEIIRR